MKLVVLILLAASIAACAAGSARSGELVFLTREGCVQTDLMRERFDAALVKVGWPGAYQVVDLGVTPRR